MSRLQTPSPAAVELPRRSLCDAELITRFVDRREETAFAELVNRFGTLVYAVALRVLRDRHAAEDVFQATFFVLARDAAKLRRRESVASWLHGTALRLAKKALVRRHRLHHSDRIEELDVNTLTPLEEVESAFDQQVFDEELQNLPPHYREVLTLHFLEEKTYEQTAAALGVTVGVVEGRLKRGKRELQLRLARRGVGLSVAVGAIAWSQSAAQAGIGEELLAATVDGGVAVSHGTPFTSNCSSEAVHLAGKEAAMLTTGKLTLACGLVIAAAAGLLSQAGERDGAVAPESKGGLETAISSPVDWDAAGRLALQQPERGAEEGVSSSSGEGSDGPGGSNHLVGGLQFDDFGGSDESRERAPEQAPARIRVSTQFPGEEEILAALDRVTNVQFPGNPLSDVLDFVGRQHGIPVLIDEAALAKRKIGTDVEIRATLSGVTLRSALKWMLKPHSLTYVVQDEVLTITTPEASQQILGTRIYDIRPLQIEDPDALIDALTETTDGPWLYTDGIGGTIAFFQETLIVRVDEQTQEQISALLNNLAGQIGAGEPAAGRSRLPRGRDAAGRTDPEENSDRKPLERLIEKLKSSEQPKTPAEITVSTDRHPNEEQILHTLETVTSGQFVDVPLGDVLNSIATEHNIQILLDQDALAESGIGPEEEIFLNLSVVTLRSALNLMLKNVGGVELAYVIEDEVMKITTREAAEDMLETRVYDVRPLFRARATEPSGPDGMGGAGSDVGTIGGMPQRKSDPRDGPDPLVDVIMDSTSGHWLDTDGIGGTISDFRGSFVIRQTQAVHAEVEKLLNNLLKQVQASEDFPDWPPPKRPERGGMGGGGTGMF